MGPFHSPDLAYAAIIGGLLIGYCELLRPGTVLPGGVGASLVMLGVASLNRFQATGVALCALAVLLILIDSWFRFRGMLAIIGGVVLAFGAHGMTEPSMRWWTAWCLSLPFSWITNTLLTIALQARANKLSP